VEEEWRGGRGQKKDDAVGFYQKITTREKIRNGDRHHIRTVYKDQVIPPMGRLRERGQNERESFCDLSPNKKVRISYSEKKGKRNIITRSR